jgi:hypothetical protein
VLDDLGEGVDGAAGQGEPDGQSEAAGDHGGQDRRRHHQEVAELHRHPHDREGEARQVVDEPEGVGLQVRDASAWTGSALSSSSAAPSSSQTRSDR